jgi:hypothetical protein
VASAALAPQLETTHQAAVENHHEVVGRGRGSAHLPAVSRAAHDGRVSDLFVTDDVERRGTFEPATAALGIKDGPGPGAREPAHLAAIDALGTGARVHAIGRARMPDNGDIAALSRY